MKTTFLIVLCFAIANVNAQVTNIATTATVSTSYVSPWEMLTAVNDGFTPASSGDRDHGVYGNWPNSDSIQWVQYGWSKQYSIDSISVYWFSDEGGVLIPTTAYVEYWNGSSWVKIADVPKVKDAFNTVVANITTDSLRVSMKNTQESTGIIEWQVYKTPSATTGKELYIPKDWQDPNANIPWDSTMRCKQSSNFAVFWGPLAGDDPTQSTNPALKFDPQVILDSLENIYGDYINKWHLLPDSGNLATYKIPVIINNTWREGLYTGYLFGGGFDNIIGAMFVDPIAAMSTDSWGLSHEFAHACQYMITNSLYPGHGFNDAQNGFFWETHAQFMAWQRHPDGLGNADPARALNFTSYTMSSARKHYANLYYLELLKDKYGIDFIGRIWREADATQHEHPFQTIQRLMSTDQAGMNNFFMEHAMRNVEWDYGTQSYIKPVMDGIKADPNLNWRPTDILDSLGKDYYTIPNALAPQQYAYNIVQLFVKDSSCSQPYVHLTFKGHVDPNASSGWLYGFVSVDANGRSTYSNQYSDSEVTYKFPQGTKEYYLVVLGAPTTFHVHTDLFEIGFPKEFRYPWEVHMSGMVPKGYQTDFHSIAGIAGAPHPNGGGFVAATAQVDATAYVAPHAAVLDNAHVTGNAKVLDKATVRQDAVVSDNAVISGFADVYGASVVKENATVSDRAKVPFTTVSDTSKITDNAVVNYGTIIGGSIMGGNVFSWGAIVSNKGEFGGDAEIFSACANGGRYLQADGLLSRPGAVPRGFCDGSYDNILNVDTNAVYVPFGEAKMAFGNTVQCGTVTGTAGAPPVVNAGADQSILSAAGTAALAGNASSPAGSIMSTQWVKITGPDAYTIADSANLSTAISGLTVGTYQFKLVATDNNDNQASDTLIIIVRKSNEPPVVNVGSDITITLPDNDANVVGTSSDADGVIKAIAWRQISGPSTAYIVSPGSLSCVMDNLAEGIYTFTLTATDNDSAAASDTVMVTVNKAATNISSGRITTPMVFPIPATDMATVNYPAAIGGVLSVYDTKGAKMLTKQIPADTNTISFSVKNLVTGVYFIRIDTYSHDKYKLKLIVAH